MKIAGNILYPTEDDVIQLRKSFKLMSGGHLSRGSLTYILDTVQDLYNEESLTEALAAKAAHILFGIISLHPFIDGIKEPHTVRLIFSYG
ncbi:MAG TPA: hypothetical protein VFS46_04160 [Nitrososphaera sp.]|nr:hypothetical protein [Nitrososphaera sp.]